MQKFTTLTVFAALAVSLATPAFAADGPKFAVNNVACDRVATLGPAGLKSILIPTPADGAELVLDIDGDKKPEHLTWRWEPSTMHPRIWFIRDGKNQSYLKPDNPSFYFDDGHGAFQAEGGYEVVWVRIDGEVFALTLGDERLRYASDLTLFNHGQAKLLCRFDASTTTKWTPVDASVHDVCQTANAGTASKVKFAPAKVDWQTGLRPPMTETSEAEQARVDIDGDGGGDDIVRWQFRSGAGRGCSLDWLDSPGERNVKLHKAFLTAQGFQKDPAAEQYSYDSEVLPRDEVGWSRCGDVNEIVEIGARLYVRANDQLTSLAGQRAQPICEGERVIRWRVKEYLK